ncbi:protein RALF-like 34 [Lactuca sativa]|uniref:Rapid ALkalinization Factor n=1 Tax=Lactuca sativa TaxID=4236 RepID=A0A9R1W364_LACSA|nr:protein RALF-like 34 [Lactuca sativa]KAJ0216243.1 hypothetical protein LSAT_V11C300135410 [Lactuca sativa]
MASLLLLTPICLVLFVLLAVTSASGVDGGLKQLQLNLVTDTMEMPFYDDVNEIEGEDDGGLTISGRRSLLWGNMRYYISYGALSANRVPCPPRSGRSYYTHNCWRARGPVHPYNRGCSTITRCRR